MLEARNLVKSYGNLRAVDGVSFTVGPGRILGLPGPNGAGKTPQAARGIAIFAVLILTMLGGGWVPAFLFPRWMQTLTLAISTRWAVDGLDAVTWRGGDFGTALLPICALLGFTAVFGLLAALRFPWDEGV